MKFSGDIVWIYGPHEGSKHDYKIFKELLMKMLEADEMVETDAGYGVVGKGAGNDGIIRSKNDYMSKEERLEKSDLRARHGESAIQNIGFFEATVSKWKETAPVCILCCCCYDTNEH